MWRICSAAVMTGVSAEKMSVHPGLLSRDPPTPPVSLKMAATQLGLCIKAELEPLIKRFVAVVVCKIIYFE